MLGYPGSLKAVFRTAIDPRDSIMAEEYVDEIVPDLLQCSISGSNSAMGRRSRLDDSAGEGLRRNVLVRNAMLSSLERERRQLVQEASMYGDAESIQQSASAAAAMDEEAQFFEDLLSELSGSDCSSATSSILEPAAPSNGVPALTIYNQNQFDDDDEDFVQLQAEVPIEPLRTEESADAQRLVSSQQDETTIGTQLPALVDSCSSALAVPPAFADSGFVEESSRPVSVASCCSGYPNVCPYPAITSFVGGSSEELPALIDDDSDVDDDDEYDEVGDEGGAGQEVAACGAEASATLSPDGDATISRPLSPLISPLHSVHMDYASFRDPLSPEPSRPTSPMSSASSKGDGDGPSPLLLPTDLSQLPSLDELTLQLPPTTRDLLARPSRALTGTWFEHKYDTASGSGTGSDRMRWTTAPASYFRPAASTSTALDFQSHRIGSVPIAAPNDPSDPNIVVHWSR